MDATNAPGNINHKIQATIMDNQNTPSVAVANATKIAIQQDHVKVIVDLSDLTSSPPGRKIVDTAQVPML